MRPPLPGTYAGGLLAVALDDPGLRVAGGASRAPTPPPESWLRDYAGGRGWGIRWLTDLSTPGTDPLAPSNPLLFVTGPLGATKARGFSRWMVMTRSPLTGGLARSVCGGAFGAALKFAGIDALALTGAAEEPSVLVLDASAGAPGSIRAALVPAGDLWGLDTQETQRVLRGRHGPAAQIACIGPAGERLVRYAAITHGTRTASRCGVGTVMGAKKLKALVVVPPRRRLQAADPRAFEALVQDHYERMKAHPRFENMRAAGTIPMTEKVHYLGMLPARNFQTATLEGLENLDTAAFQAFKTGNHACWGCATRCGQVHHVRFGPFAGEWSEGPEYESVWALGPEVGLVDPAAIIAADHLCDRLGLDTISTGVSIGFLFELAQRGLVGPAGAGGLLSPAAVEGLDLTWGNSATILELIRRIAFRQGVGDLLAQGTRCAAETLGGDAPHYAMHAKGLELPAYDPRGAKAHGMGYALSNIGGSHMYGYARQEISAYKEPRPLDPQADTGKGDVIAWNQIRKAIEETLILCNFADTAMDLPFLAGTLWAATGLDPLGDLDHLWLLGERIVTLERQFNLREGFSRKNDVLPSRMLTEPLVQAGPNSGELIREPDTVVDEYYAALGYDADGRPTAATLGRLGLD
ncbi:MAG: aldehyde ferredoxin oxidoreductase family protein [Thermoleophilia bacterium]|nr:aldehyde ferredoxin oxidoreductase family protein [Thermoleophilia bacterium]